MKQARGQKTARTLYFIKSTSPATAQILRDSIVGATTKTENAIEYLNEFQELADTNVLSQRAPQSVPI